jgi:hypothetical protein
MKISQSSEVILGAKFRIAKFRIHPNRYTLCKWGKIHEKMLFLEILELAVEAGPGKSADDQKNPTAGI